MRKKRIILMLLLAAALTACQNTGKEQTAEEQAAEEQEAEEQAEEEQTKEEQSEGEQFWPEEEKSCLILEDEDSLYVCGAYRLLKINKESSKAEVLWEESGEPYREAPYLYAEGSGLLLNDKIYFIEAWKNEEETESRALSVIGIDGSGYQRIEQLPEYSFDSSMLVLDGRLYVKGNDRADSTLLFEVYADGTLSERIAIEQAESYQNVRDYTQISYMDNGSRTLFAPQSMKDFGCLILKNEDYELIKIEPETGREIPLEGELKGLEAYNDKYILTCEYEDVWKLYLTDKETLEKSFLTEFDVARTNIISMDEDYLYTERRGIADNKGQYLYEKISLKDGEVSLLFCDDAAESISYDEPQYLSDIILKNGYLYYVGAEDYKLYLMRRNLEEPSREEKLGEAFYDTGISQVGTIESYQEEFYSQSIPEFLLAQLNLKWLQVDERFAGAEKINRCLKEYQDNNIAYEKDNAVWLEEDVKTYGDGILSYSYTSTLDEISYFDEKYLSFCQQDYDYMGGAHGMPVWTGFTFDLTTGQRLELQDVIGNSEEELKEIVTEHFAEIIEKNPDNFWEDAVDSVREGTSFDSQFYLTEEGIKFYFSPYMLASYAAGFQEVTIPYEEFVMKIEIP